ncbi:hypothetical protein, variant [Spizellomyces punctatus DAOM BR117]|nr:hypothetical protein, variant [Spizellomyces punctatus DAOM BR117]KNC99152.1 hypothetical protein, variant [Spizellomyces punctatus DAOM BR117]|eukprot:XP_016607192.1 hypothetical protein, variant [Spizellomyces punctatus DAOM BR117]
MTPVLPPQPPPAKRLLLVVADGLRADKLFENRLERAPFLRGIVEHHGTWGVSHTRVPTESRPGHVALIAGFYEDVSAVTKGWKMNPVNFDSVFNQSTHTWSFGSPDILPMFAEGASDKNKVETFMYPAESEDFAEDASGLDTWVFEKFEAFLDSVKHNTTLEARIRQQGIVIFLHLLGLDTNGHAYRPYSKEYLNNIQLVDEGLQKVVRKFESLFDNDGRTAYIFTSDHGMSNRGNHGDGHPDNTQTPLIAWGSGVATPNRTHPVGHDDLSKPWQLSDIKRVDVEQADIAPLMSTLIGLPFPMNSVGVLPLQYLSASVHAQALSAFANAKQILSQYLVKADAKKRTEPFFKEFHPLLGYEELITTIETEIRQLRHSDAIRLSSQLIRLSLQGLRYFQTYDWLFLRSIISFGYLGWIAYSTIFILRRGIVHVVKAQPMPLYGSSDFPRRVNILAVVIALAFAALLHRRQAPAFYYAYTAFPIFFWAEVFKQRAFIVSLLRTAQPSRTTWIKTLAGIALYVVGLELLVYSYFRRELLTVCLWLLGVLWPRTMAKRVRSENSGLVWVWTAFCLGTSVFPLLPVEKGEDLSLVLAGGTLILASGVFALFRLPHITKLPLSHRGGPQPQKLLRIVVLEILLIAISILVTADTTLRLRAKTGLPFLNQIFSWGVIVLLVGILTIDGAQHAQHYLRRLTVIYLAFAPAFILLTISYEAIFYFCFSGTVLSWLLLERSIYLESEQYPALEDDSADATPDGTSRAPRTLKLSDLRVAGFFLCFINVAFFGTGNIASVSSFSLESVYRFTTVFNPFLMGALLILKILIPFFLLSSVFAVLGRALRLPPFSLFLLVLSTTDVMTLNFFFLVRDSGSWLEIGTTISHFVIASAFIVFQIILFVVSYGLVGTVLVPDIVSRRKKRT